MSLPDPPLHMKPGSPEFIQWMLLVRDYADNLVGFAEPFSAGYSMALTQFGIATAEVPVLTAAIQYKTGGNILAQYFAELHNNGSAFTVTVRLKKDGALVDSFVTNTANPVDSWFYAESCSDNNSHTFTVTMQASFLALCSYTGLVVQKT